MDIRSKKVDKEISDITSQLEKLEIVYNTNRNKLLEQRRKLLVKEKNKNKNPFKVGQRVRIINNYTRDYGTVSQGLIGTITKVNKVQVNLLADNNYYYTRSYKNLELVE